MSEKPLSGKFGQSDAAPALDWENLSQQSSGVAFRRSLKELVLHPGRFFDRMATTGGLREPLTFLLLIGAAMILMSFPLALSYFGLTAPDPLDPEVTTQQYNWHLLAPRLSGFITVLLPVTLVVAGVLAVAEGTFFHLGARFFGARNWEGSVSIWCYAKSAGGAAAVAAEAVACVIAIACYLLTLVWPAARPGAARLVQVGLLALGGAALLGSVLLFFSALGRGCIHSFRLPAERGVAAALAGVLLATLAAAGIGVGFLKWGLVGGLITAASAAILAVILTLVNVLSGRAPGALGAESGSG